MSQDAIMVIPMSNRIPVSLNYFFKAFGRIKSQLYHRVDTVLKIN